MIACVLWGGYVESVDWFVLEQFFGMNIVGNDLKIREQLSKATEVVASGEIPMVKSGKFWWEWWVSEKS